MLDPETKDLIRRGIHPDQLALEDYHFFKYSWSLELRRRDAIKAQKAHLENQRQQQEQEEVEDTGPHQPLRRVTQRLPQRNIFYIHSGYFVPKPTKHTQPFDVTCTLDYHAFLYDRFEYFPCKNSEDLERPRVKVAEASMSLINYCNQTRDYMVPSVWGQVDRKEDPYNPQSGGSEGCCSVM